MNYINLAYKKYLSERAIDISIIGIVFITLSIIWAWASQYSYIPCISDCGETFISHFYARNYDLFGFKYGLIEDHATSPYISAHPYYYTHNPNIGGYSFVLYHILGFTSYVEKQFIVLMVFGFGILLTYKTVKYLTKNQYISFSVVLFMCIDFGFFASFALHSLRVWAWLSIAGILYFSAKMVNEPQSLIQNCCGLFLFNLTSLAIGYEFWILFIPVILLILSLYGDYKFSFKYNIKLYSLAILCIMLPFILRQIHVAIVLGYEYWLQDFIYTFAIKIPFVSLFINIPAIEQIDIFYKSLNIMRPPSDPIQSVATYMNHVDSFLLSFQHIIVPKLGLLGLFVTIFVFILSVMAVIKNLLSKLFNVDLQTSRILKLLMIERMYNYFTIFNNVDKDSSENCKIIESFLRIYFCLFFGVIIGSLLILAMIVPFYVSMGMPLLGIIFILAKGYLAGVFFQKTLKKSLIYKNSVYAILLFMLVDNVIVQYQTFSSIKPMETNWINAILSNAEATYAVSFIAPVVAAFTKNWVVGVQPNHERKYLDRIQDGKSPFNENDLFLFGEADAEEMQSEYLKPDYWIYFPIDIRAQYYSVESQCRFDYLTELLSDIRSKPLKSDALKLAWINHHEVNPGSIIQSGLSFGKAYNIKRADLYLDGEYLLPYRVNCIHDYAIADIKLPQNIYSGNHHLTVKIYDYNEGVVEVYVAEINVDDAMPIIKDSHQATSQLSIKELIGKYDNIDVEEINFGSDVSTGYVIINLKKFK